MSDATEATGAVFALVVNGEQRSAKRGDTVADLLCALGLENGRVAIERNLQILPRAQWAETKLAAGDRYEIVQFVGGG
jgi:thiamine biosynthesis protein ThiS